MGVYIAIEPTYDTPAPTPHMKLYWGHNGYPLPASMSHRGSTNSGRSTHRTLHTPPHRGVYGPLQKMSVLTQMRWKAAAGSSPPSSRLWRCCAPVMCASHCCASSEGAV